MVRLWKYVMYNDNNSKQGNKLFYYKYTTCTY